MISADGYIIPQLDKLSRIIFDGEKEIDNTGSADQEFSGACTGTLMCSKEEGYDNMKYDSDNFKYYIKLQSAKLSHPAGGVSYNLDPKLKVHSNSTGTCTDTTNEVLTAIGIKIKVQFPEDFQWNQGGYLPGIHGVYMNTEVSSAIAQRIFECKWRWDAKGKLSISLKHFSDDPNEWIASIDKKIQLDRKVWYDLSIIVTTDGLVQATVDGQVVYCGSCYCGLDAIHGVKWSVYCVDNSGVEDKIVSIKDVYVAGNVDSTI